MRTVRVALTMMAAMAISTVSAATTDVVMADPSLRACAGIRGNAQPMHPEPFNGPDCLRLPGANLFDEAGRAYQSGDHRRAAELALQAATAGNALAQLKVAILYDAGDGVPRSDKSAIYWYSRAAAQGEPESQTQLGYYYEDGASLPENWNLAARLYRGSAMQGWNKGEFALGRAYEFGIGVPQSRADAIAWFKRAGAQGNGQASYFANWLSDPTNNIGFRNQLEHDLVIGNKLRFGGSLIGADPAGITFQNSAQRALWLGGLRARVDAEEAQVFSDIRHREYEDCRRDHRDDCVLP